MRTARILICVVTLATLGGTAEATHRPGHVPTVQPQPGTGYYGVRPYQQPYQQPRVPSMVQPPQPRPLYPQEPTLGDPRPYRHTDPAKCRSLLCD